ncbi:MAG: DUF58 domain-containing protein [Anaerolineales bacterium]|nr:DUF58 domain-containing protein [Anaerolineales bacterium]MCB0012405.1 DUF58 domain-containing protein [Anaerolineales bacterium]MCB8959615.1 DUF58 domain-containing protein [Ardenticatenales bacterium]
MSTLFDETTLRKLEQLTLVADHVRVGMMKGDRRSRKRGTSIEFADYRDYTRGDDLRRLDWNVYARLERPFIKLLEEEEDLAVHLLIDASRSMDWPEEGEPDHHKLNFALRVAGALGHISLTAGDNLTVTLVQSRGNERWGPSRGKQNSLRLLQFLDGREGAGITDLNVSLREYALRGGRPGLAFVLSDLLSPNGFQPGIDALLGRGYEVGLIHILSPDELRPGAAGDLKLVDIETGAESEITLDDPTLAQYLARLREWQTEIAAFCSARQVHYVPVSTELAWDRLILHTLRQKGVVR